jgi:hypothetical protein
MPFAAYALACARASSGVEATDHSGTGKPARVSRVLAWYSCSFTGVHVL